MNVFNLRVYGIFLKNGKVLITDERQKDFRFTKFPGGGMEFGESTIECLKREFKEEFNADIDVKNHFYTTDVFVPSFLNPKQQVMSIYYFIESRHFDYVPFSNVPFEMNAKGEHELWARWMDLDKLTEALLTFPIDKIVLQKLKNG